MYDDVPGQQAHTHGGDEGQRDGSTTHARGRKSHRPVLIGRGRVVCACVGGVVCDLDRVVASVLDSSWG